MFLLYRTLKNAKQLALIVRSISNQGPLVDLTVDNDGVAIMTLQRPPVNAINLDVLQQISKSLDEVTETKSKGMILTSSLPTVFSAGLDLTEVYKPNLKRLELFWTTLQDVWLKLFGSSFPTAAAINGHTSAGACVLAMSCEYRVMVNGNHTMGLNDTILGIAPPKWVMDTMCQTIPLRKAEYAIMTSQMFTPEEALKVGLIDEPSTDKSEAIAKCKAYINKFDKIPPLARTTTKQKIRGAVIKNLQNNRQADTLEFLNLIKTHKVQQNLEIYLRALKNKAGN